MESHKLEDVIEYQEQGKRKVYTVKGVDTISAGDDTSGWNWRGKGIIKIASSHWEILGWGIDHTSSSSPTTTATSASTSLGTSATSFVSTSAPPSEPSVEGKSNSGVAVNGYDASDGPHER